MDKEIKHSSNSSFLEILLNEFKPQGLTLDGNINFFKWKLCDLRKFLKLVEVTGFSKAKKEVVAVKVETLWNNFKADPTPMNQPINIETDMNIDKDKNMIDDDITDNSRNNCQQINNNTPPPEFMKWNISKLQDYLGERGINRSGNKQTLVRNALGAYNMNLPLETDVQEELEEIKTDIKRKLWVEGGIIKLPNPLKLTNGWIPAPQNLPNTLFDQIKDHLDAENAGKAYKGGQSLLESGDLTNIMSHAISSNIRYCFVRGLCLPEQKLNKSAYNVWIVLHKDTGNIITGDCSCPAGYVSHFFLIYSSGNVLFPSGIRRELT